MPGYRGHLVGGSIAFALLCIAIRPPFSFVGQCELLLLTCLGALFPDIDTKSCGQRYFYSLLGILFAILFFYHQFIVISLLALVGIVPLIVPHRGPFHNPKIICCIVMICIFGLSGSLSIRLKYLWWQGLFFFTGALSHLLLDYGIKKFVKKLF
jgi:hypothetical protein